MILPSFHWAKHIGWHGGNSSTRLVGGTSATQTPCELHSILRSNPYYWTFLNCNISFIMDQSTNKTTNKWLLQVAYGKTCPTLGALLFAWQQNHSVGCMKSKDQHTVGKSCLFWCSVFAMICPFKNPPNFRHFDDILNLCIHSLKKKKLYFYFYISFFLSIFFFASFFSYYYLSVFMHPMKTIFCQKRLFHCFLVFRHIGEYISLDLFYQFCQPYQ